MYDPTDWAVTTQSNVDAEPPIRCREEVGVAVGDDAEPEPRREPGERGGGVGERRPGPDRHPERGGRAVVRGEPVVRADLAERHGQDLPVGPVRTGLQPCLGPGVDLQQLVVGRLDGEGREARAQPGQDAGLPVDQGPVAVERERLELGVVERRTGHRGFASC